MKSRYYIEILVSLSLIALLPACSCDSGNDTTQINDSINQARQALINKTKVENSKFSLTNFNDDTLYLFGKHKLNQAVTLIDNHTGIHFESKTSSYLVLEIEPIGEVVQTRILPEDADQPSPEYIAFFTHDPGDYRKEKQENVTDDQLIVKFDSLIRSTTYLHELMKQNGESVLIPDSILSGILPELFRVKTGFCEYFVATYKLFDHSTIGPRLAIMDGNTVVPLTGQCSSDYFYTFHFNGKDYIQAASLCCDCGIAGEQIFEVEEHTIKLVFEDYSFSD
jgi:hypothetical protein